MPKYPAAWSPDRNRRQRLGRPVSHLATSLLSLSLILPLVAVGCNGATTKQAKSAPKVAAPVHSDHASAQQESDNASGHNDHAGDIPTQGESPKGETSAPVPAFKLLTEEHALEEIGKGEAQIAKVCERNKTRLSSVIRAFCRDNKRPTSLLDLQQSLGVDPDNFQGFAATAHSSSLVARYVSAINPRVINFATSRGGGAGSSSLVATGFVRGEQLVEIIAASPDDGSLDFFLVAFSQSCNSRPPGCPVGDLLTAAVESNWTTATVYQDEDLKNSIFDCRQCHQPDGLSSPKKLLMQELTNPWTHWLQTANASSALLADYQAAHGNTETYAGITGNNMRNSSPANLERFIRGNTQNGGNLNAVFDSRAIARELSQSPGSSATWNSLFDRSVRGEIIPVPYYDLRVTDPALLAKFTKQYTDVRDGRMPAAAMEDHRKVLKQDPKELAAMGFAVPQDLTPDKMLTLACAQCHNSKLDQSISRSKFNVNLATMKNAADEIDVAIRRIALGYSYGRRKALGILFETSQGKEVTDDIMDHVETMPPARFKRLSDAQIDALIEYLKGQKPKTPN